jgi:hypothetical protein
MRPSFASSKSLNRYPNAVKIVKYRTLSTTQCHFIFPVSAATSAVLTDRHPSLNIGSQIMSSLCHLQFLEFQPRSKQKSR